MNRLRAAAFVAALLWVLPASANFAFSPSGGTTMFAIDAANQGTSLCAAANTECAAHVNIGVDGAPIAALNVGTSTVTGTDFIAVNGAASNASSAVATNTVNTQAVAYNYGYNGTTWDQLQVDAAKNLKVVQGGNSFAHISTATTTTVKSGAGVVHTVTINNLGTVASVTTVYDNTAGSGTVIAAINTLAGQTSYVYDVAFATGLTLVTTGTVAPDVTVSYR